MFSGPHHPYTEALLSANPSLENEDAQRIRLSGELPSVLNLPSGCVFHTRCPRKLGSICEREEPPLIDAGDGHAIRCHIPAAELGRATSARCAQPPAKCRATRYRARLRQIQLAVGGRPHAADVLRRHR